MKILLNKDVDNLGYAGEVVNVANGYGLNYLVPQGFAVPATAGALKQAEAWRSKAAARMAELQSEYEELSGRVSSVTLEFKALAGDSGKLYGSVTTAHITEKLNELLGTDIDRRKMIGEPIRQLGEHRVTLRLSRDYQPHVLVSVVSEAEEIVVEDLPVEDESELPVGELPEGELAESDETTENIEEADLIESNEESSDSEDEVAE